MMNQKTVTLIIVSVVLQYADSSRILFIHPSPSKSHLLIAKPLLVEMAKRGHDVTMVSSFPLSKPVKNYRDVYYPVGDAMGGLMSEIITKGENIFMKIPRLVEISCDGANKTIHSPEFQKIMKEETFDLVIIGLFMNDYLLGFGAHFGCPTAVIWPIGSSITTDGYVGNPSTIATVPHMMLGNKNPMTFMDRVANLFFNCFDIAAAMFANERNQVYYNSIFPSDKYPSYEEVKKNVSLVLLNQHFTQAVPRPYVQNIIEVGGLQVKQKPSPLPDDIKKWLDEAEHGAIFLSFGTNLKFSLLDKQKLDAFVKPLSKLKQRVLWKWDTDEMENKPDNVMIGKWLPQDDILAHPNLKLFISHGGLGSVVEAKYHGVPVIGVPVYGDQQANIGTVEEEGWGYQLDLETITEEKLSKALDEVLNNPKYLATVKKISALYRDRPQSSMELAVFWLEYVIRHKGAPHMRYQGVDLNFFQSNSLDVLVFIAIIIYIIYFILKKIILKLLGLLCRKKKQKTQ